MPSSIPLSAASLASAQQQLAELRAQGDALQARLASGGVRTAWEHPAPSSQPGSPQRAAASRRSVERDGFAVGDSRRFDPSFRRAIASEDARVAADLERMRREAEEAHDAEARRAAEERQRADALEAARQELLEAARERDALKDLGLALPTSRAPDTQPGGGGGSDVDARRSPGVGHGGSFGSLFGGLMDEDLAAEEELPLSALAEQTRSSLRRARETLDAQRHAHRLPPARSRSGAVGGAAVGDRTAHTAQAAASADGPTGSMYGTQVNEQARARARQELTIAEDGGWLGWALGIGGLAPHTASGPAAAPSTADEGGASAASARTSRERGQARAPRQPSTRADGQPSTRVDGQSSTRADGQSSTLVSAASRRAAQPGRAAQLAHAAEARSMFGVPEGVRSGWTAAASSSTQPCTRVRTASRATPAATPAVATAARDRSAQPFAREAARRKNREESAQPEPVTGARGMETHASSAPATPAMAASASVMPADAPAHRRAMPDSARKAAELSTRMASVGRCADERLQTAAARLPSPGAAGQGRPVARSTGVNADDAYACDAGGDGGAGDARSQGSAPRGHTTTDVADDSKRGRAAQRADAAEARRDQVIAAGCLQANTLEGATAQAPTPNAPTPNAPTPQMDLLEACLSGAREACLSGARTSTAAAAVRSVGSGGGSDNGRGGSRVSGGSSGGGGGGGSADGEGFSGGDGGGSEIGGEGDDVAGGLLLRARELRACAEHTLAAGASEGSGSSRHAPPPPHTRARPKSAELRAAEAAAHDRLARLGLASTACASCSGGAATAGASSSGQHAPRRRPMSAAGTAPVGLSGATHARRMEGGWTAATAAGVDRSWPPSMTAQHGGGAAGSNGGGGMVEQLSEAAFERVRSAFPRASVERRMFHSLAGVAHQPEGPEGRRRRVAETFGRGVPLHATRAEACCICLDAMCKGDLAVTLTCGHMCARLPSSNRVGGSQMRSL